MLKPLAIVVITAALVGCASPATQQAMLVDRNDINSKISVKLKESIYVQNVGGGKDTNPLWTSQVDSKTYKSALENSLTAVGYRSYDSNAKYKVDAVLQELDQPLFGLTFDVKSTVAYTVTTPDGLKSIPITATGTATTSDAFMGIERLKIANERSIKENIKSFINEMTERFGN
jgi:hypothetical protein